MSAVSRIFIRDLKYRCQLFPRLQTHSSFSTAVDVACNESSDSKNVDKRPTSNRIKKTTTNSYPSNYRFVYPEFLPNPIQQMRNSIREKIERKDMLARRTILDIPEFYVGSILAVTHSDVHAAGKTNRFVGICILRKGCGMRASFVLRNIVDGQAMEIDYDLYDPCIQKIECLKLEKRLDDHLLYLRDCPPEYSTFPFDLEPEFIMDRKEVPVNTIQIPLLPQPWVIKYELLNLKGIKPESIVINKHRTEKLLRAAQPWENYDLMKMYRNTIPEEEQNEIYSELYTKFHQLEMQRQKQKRSRIFVRPKKQG